MHSERLSAGRKLIPLFYVRATLVVTFQYLFDQIKIYNTPRTFYCYSLSIPLTDARFRTAFVTATLVVSISFATFVCVRTQFVKMAKK
jgi:hypothetical protein